MNRMRFKLASSLRPLIHQAMCQIDEALLNHQARREASRQAVELDCATPGWLQPHPQRDLAARLAGALALRNSLRVGYLALGECAAHAMVRICLQTGGISRSALEDRELSKEETQRLVLRATDLAYSKLMLHEQAVNRNEVRAQTKEFIKEANAGTH